MSKYVASRKDVCAGELLKNVPFTVYDENHNLVSEEGLAEQGICISGGLVCRGMLFNVNDNGLANDLIYTTPLNYPIEGIEHNVVSQNIFVINNYVELEELLEYMKYGVDLTQKDLDQIYRKLVAHNWWLRHHTELFGLKKDNMVYYSGGTHYAVGTQTLPLSIYENLRRVSLFQNGKPHEEEPGYSLIRKIKA